jgi:lipoyl-dependent peroxiredoxin
MAVRTSEAVWEGTLRDGRGTLRVGEHVFKGEYTFGSRFEEDPGTNPEELIGAAHAGCFSMALSGDLVKAGYTPKRIQTRAEVHLDKVDGRQTITRIHLASEAEVPEIDDETFKRIAEGTKEGCPVSRALAAIDVTLSAQLAGAS